MKCRISCYSTDLISIYLPHSLALFLSKGSQPCYQQTTLCIRVFFLSSLSSLPKRVVKIRLQTKRNKWSFVFWLISIVQDEARLTDPNYQTHHPVLRVKKSRISRGIITVRMPCDQEFTASDAVIEELISFRPTHHILQISAGTFYDV